MGFKRVGQRIHVYWTDETAWFSGVVKQFSATQGYYVVYDDGDARWEAVNESYRFDGQQGSDTDDNDDDDLDDDGDVAQDEEQVSTDREEMTPAGDKDEQELASRNLPAPTAMEPPTTDSEGDDGEDEKEEAPAIHGPKSAAYPLPVVLRDSEDDTDSEVDKDGDDTQSVALSDAPIMHELPRSQARQPTTVDRRRQLPLRGILRGFVLRATVPLVDKCVEPTALVRVAFAESSNGTDDAGHRHANALMLRCKQALAATQVASASIHPTWNDVDDGVETSQRWSERDGFDGLFQLQLVPPMVSVAGTQHQQPAWLQLKGDLLFSVYHQETDETRRSEFVGQAVLSLSHLMRDVFRSQSTERFGATTQYLALESRQGRPLRGTSGGAELVVKFQFEPDVCVSEQKKPLPRSSEEVRAPATARAPTPSLTSSSSARPKSALAPTPTPTPTSARAESKCRRPHESSSQVNRRRFEKQLERENEAMAKRVAEQRRESGALAARRQQLNHQPRLQKSEPKRGMIAVATTPPRTHKASSAINRSKFVDHVKRENKSMGKRLVERAGLSDHGGGRQRLRADAKLRDELDWDDDKAQDKAHVTDKRCVLRQEKDYLLDKAQAKYQQQNELVEDVMALQTQVGELKTKLFGLKSALQRVDATNTKDSHARDCLRRAAEKSKRLPPVSSSCTVRKVRLEQLVGSDDDEQEEKDPAIAKARTEMRAVLAEGSSLESEKRRLEGQTAELDKQEAVLSDEIVELHRKSAFVQAKRAFHAKMAAGRATFVSAAYTSNEMRGKLKSMELSVEEDEQYAIFQAQEEFAQLQIATTVLRDRVNKRASGAAPRAASIASSASAACENLREKIAKRTAKLESLESQQRDWQQQYEQLVASCEYETLRAQAQELQHLLFLCQSEAKHVAAAERAAKPSKDKLERELQTQRFNEQTETDILLKKSRTAGPPPRSAGG